MLDVFAEAEHAAPAATAALDRARGDACPIHPLRWNRDRAAPRPPTVGRLRLILVRAVRAGRAIRRDSVPGWSCRTAIRTKHAYLPDRSRRTGAGFILRRAVA